MAKPQEIEILDKLSDEEPKNNLICADNLAKIFNTHNTTLNVMHLNIRSIRKNFDELQIFLDTFKLHNCDIIILSESWQIMSIKQFNIKGYTTYYNGGNYNQNDGTIIFIKSEINAEIELNKLPNSQVSMNSIKFITNNIAYQIITLYRPPSTNIHLFLRDLDEYLNDSTREQVDIFTGDVNIDITDNSNNAASEYSTMLAHYGFTSYINNPTRVTKNSTSCLDHIFIRKKLNIGIIKFNTATINYDITDHFPIILNITQENRATNNNTSIKAQTKYDYDKITLLLGDKNWQNILNIHDPNIATNAFVKELMETIESSKITMSVKYKQHKKNKPWITNAIITSIKHRDKMKRSLIKNYSDDREIEYKTYRNNLNRIINFTKNDYYKNKINATCGNLKKIYEIISEATNEHSKKNNNIHILDNDEKQFDTDYEMANFCNQYYTNVGVDMLKNIPHPQDPFILPTACSSSMYLRPINENELIKYINDLKNNSSPGIDGISSKIIKIIHPYISTPLKHIINSSFRTGIVPDHFKVSVITPIHKAGNHKNISNFRPISLVNHLTKVFEKCLKERLIDFLNMNNILSPNQYGFVKGLSTEDALYTVTKEITDSLNNNNKCIAVFLDLAKAFDTVPHDILITVLQQCGIRGVVLDIFKNYLGLRTQYVKIRNTLSEPQLIKIGIPQGTVLGPILFNLYINSLSKLQIDGKVISYADDTVLLFSNNTWNLTKDLVKKGMQTVVNWLHTMKLSLNIKKTKYVAFSITDVNRPDYNSITIDNLNEKIEEATHVKYLGVIIDKHLKWDIHVTQLTKRIRCLLHKFYILREILNQKLLVTIYKSLVESLLRYGIVVWGGLYSNSLIPLNLIQNYILKIIYKKNRRYSTELLYSGEIRNVRTLYFVSACTFIHKNEKLKIYCTHQYETRNKNNKHIVIPHSTRNKNQRFLNYLGPKLYNLIPLEIKQSKNLKNFIHRSNQFIIQNYSTFMNTI